jgi:hypothetical protein
LETFKNLKMSMNQVITASQVFESFKYVLEKYPEDKAGLNLLRINFDNKRPGPQGVKYIDVEILKRNGANYDYIPLNLKFMNLTTKGNLIQKPDPSREKTVPGARLVFSHDASYTSTYKDVEGKTVIVLEEYGRAKTLVCRIYIKLVYDAFKAKRIVSSSKNISTSVQTMRKGNDKDGIKTKLQEPILRTEVKFNDPEHKKTEKTDVTEKKNIGKNWVPSYAIYDATRLIPTTDSRYKPGQSNYEILQFKNPDGKYTEINYGNASEIIKPGSICTGVDCMSSGTISNMGVGLPSKALILIIKPGKGITPDINEIFTSEDFSQITQAEPGVSSSEVSTKSKEPIINVPTEEFDQLQVEEPEDPEDPGLFDEYS